jgi:hypothetical protein
MGFPAVYTADTLSFYWDTFGMGMFVGVVLCWLDRSFTFQIRGAPKNNGEVEDW